MTTADQLVNRIGREGLLMMQPAVGGERSPEQAYADFRVRVRAALSDLVPPAALR